MANKDIAGGSGLTELWARLKFVVIALIVYRIGAHIPVPGINPDQLQAIFEQNKGTILAMFNMFSGGALENMSILALGIMPYISSSIIMQLFTAVFAPLKELQKEGEAGRRKINQYTRYGTVLLALVQASGMAAGLSSQPGLIYMNTASFYVVAITTLVGGAVFLMWLGEQITERGVGNGISLLIFAGIVAGLPGAIGSSLEIARSEGSWNLIPLLIYGLIALAAVIFIVFVERGQRRVTVNYAKRQVGNQVYAAQSQHLPLKVNMAGVIPPIFASSLLLFPASIAQWFGNADGMDWLKDIAQILAPGQPLYLLLFALGVIFFCFFYTALMFDPREIADNLKKSGAFLPGIRPGKHTADYIDGVVTRLTLFGAMYITLVSLMPQVLQVAWNMPFYVGGTSLLIVVVVLMDFMAQVQAHLMSNQYQYQTLLSKSNIKNYGRK